MGLEPTTSALRVRRATHCATPPLKGRYTWRGSAQMYKDRDLIFYLYYYNCLQKVKESFNKQK